MTAIHCRGRHLGDDQLFLLLRVKRPGVSIYTENNVLHVFGSVDAVINMTREMFEITSATENRAVQGAYDNAVCVTQDDTEHQKFHAKMEYHA